MSTFNPASLNVVTQPSAVAAPIPFCGIQPGELLTDPLLLYNSTGQALQIPLLAADPAAVPAANSVFIYAVLTGGNYTLRFKLAAGTVKSVAVT